MWHPFCFQSTMDFVMARIASEKLRMQRDTANKMLVSKGIHGRFHGYHTPVCGSVTTNKRLLEIAEAMKHHPNIEQMKTVMAAFNDETVVLLLRTFDEPDLEKILAEAE